MSKYTDGRCTVVYHSREWDTLVETGWITLYVDDGIATMLYHPILEALMPKGTPITLKCPKCSAGKWRRQRAVRGCRATGEAEKKISRSKHVGHGSGGGGFRGHRGLAECKDCGHRWYSTHPSSGRVPCLLMSPCPACKALFTAIKEGIR